MCEWEGQDFDLLISCNEAVYSTRQGIFVRYDVDKPEFHFCLELPVGVVPIMPRRCRNVYHSGFWFAWHNIGMKDALPTACIALYLAAYFGAPEIVVCGLDALLTGDRGYHPSVANERNKAFGLRNQKESFRMVRRDILERTKHYEGTPICSTLD